MSLKCQACEKLEYRMLAVEQELKSVSELVILLNEVKAALRIFIKMAKVVKWIATLVMACSGLTWAYRHFGTGI